MSVPVGSNHPLIEVMSYVDQGLIPFAACPTCDELMPHSVDHGFAGLSVICCKCRSIQPVTALQFLSETEAGALGWRFSVLGEKPPN